MRTTASFNLFPDAPSERAMARARWLAREGRLGDAEAAYRDVLDQHPDMKAGWAEYFELLRGQGRTADALRVAQQAQARFPEAAFPLALVGAALMELDRPRDALTVLERAVERDPDLGLVWHELGYAAYRLGDKNRALLALDRAFALDPHTDTLKLRGRILREAGRYAAAEVAFEAAAQAAEHREQRAEAEREIAATRRYAFYAPRRPDQLNPAERWFGDTGTVVLSPRPGPVAPSDGVLVAAFLELAHDRGWRFGQVVVAGPTLPCWTVLAEGLSAPLAGRGAFDPGAIPLVVAPRPLPADATWAACAGAVPAQGSGLVFVLEHPAVLPAAADVIGVLTDGGARRGRMPDVAHAVSEAQHPAAALAGRRLGA
ncbi:MAG TPA: tetratricopeptide repeat protein [Gemmatimonadales bacterium]|nr:tetratricopeptide repeat protein [Gemmatimonadales bacterium]